MKFIESVICQLMLLSFALANTDIVAPSMDDFIRVVRRVESLEQSLSKSKYDLHKKYKEIENLEEELSDIKTKCSEKAVGTEKDKPHKYTYDNYACEGSTLSIECPSGRDISITQAEYGVYQYACGDGECCRPHPTDDCVESVEENHYPDYIALLAVCQNQPSCEVNIAGATLYECTDQLLDYAHVFYSCLPEPATEVIAFTAYSTLMIDYTVGETMAFDVSVTNFGGYYNLASGLFTCPINGVYVFSLSLGGYAVQISASITIEGVAQASARCHDVNYSQGSTTVMVECSGGQRVWAEVQIAGTAWGDPTRRYTSFSGFLLESY